MTRFIAILILSVTVSGCGLDVYGYEAERIESRARAEALLAKMNAPPAPEPEDDFSTDYTLVYERDSYVGTGITIGNIHDMMRLIAGQDWKCDTVTAIGWEDDQRIHVFCNYGSYHYAFDPADDFRSYRYRSNPS